jgi:hypothetical protein
VPVTPFHLGPAVALKPLLGARLSLGAFALVQGVIDVESVWNILWDQWPVHARLHTLPGALAVAAVCAAVGKPLCSRLNAALARWAAGRADIPAWVCAELTPVTWAGSTLGAALGGLTHVALDGMMHPDMEPLSPWVSGNPLLVYDSFLPIHAACAALGLLGLAAWRALRRRPAA